MHLGKGGAGGQMAADLVDPCFHVRRVVGGDKTQVTVHDEFEQTCTTVSVADYPRYRAAMEKARGMLDSAVIFDKAGSVTKPEDRRR